MADETGTQSRRDLFQKAVWAAGAMAAGSPARAQTASTASELSPCMRFFPSNFRNERIKTSGAEINEVIGGSGPPVLLFHGAPQSVITWRLIAPDLAKDYTLVMCDLRGYGNSSKLSEQRQQSLLLLPISREPRPALFHSNRSIKMSLVIYDLYISCLEALMNRVQVSARHQTERQVGSRNVASQCNGRDSFSRFPNIDDCPARTTPFGRSAVG